MLKLLTIARDYGACTHIRIRQIVKEIQKRNLAMVWEVDVIDAMHEAEKKIEEGMAKADLVWFGRSVDPVITGHVIEMQRIGKKVLFDLDDFLLDISPWSTHYDLFGQEEFYCEGKAVWKDKVNIDLVANRKRNKDYIDFLRLVGAISVTTPQLMECFKPYANRIYVFPNTVDIEACNFGVPIKKDSSKVRILWQGGVSHYEDFWEIKEVIPEITDKYPQVQWIMNGAFWEFFWKNIPSDRVDYVHWGHIEAFPYRTKLIGPDIGIAPLRDTKFNRCKSSIKFYEHAALGIPTVASNIPPYSDDIKDGVNGYLASDSKDWVDKLSRLIEDASERIRIGEEARKYVERERSVEVITPLIVKAMESYVNGKRM